MKHISSKRSSSATYLPDLMWLFTALLLATNTALAHEELTKRLSNHPYQSTFEDYHAFSPDALTNWPPTKSNNHLKHPTHQVGSEASDQKTHHVHPHDAKQGESHEH